MPSRHRSSWSIGISVIASLTLTLGLLEAFIPAGAAIRPGLAFREDWTETPAALPVTQEHVAHADVILSLHGPGGDRVKKSHHDQPSDDPYYVWSGETPAPWALSLRHRHGPINMSGQARVRWRAKQSGFHELRLIVQLAGGQWLIADQADGASVDWRERDFPLADLRWRALDIFRVMEGRWVEQPDLSAVREIGVTDLRAGGGTPASSRLDWIEVFGAVVTGPGIPLAYLPELVGDPECLGRPEGRAQLAMRPRAAGPHRTGMGS